MNREYSKELQNYQEEIEKSAKEYEQAEQEAKEIQEYNTEEPIDTLKEYKNNTDWEDRISQSALYINLPVCLMKVYINC